MLRTVVLLLIVANAALLAWAQGWLPVFGALPSESGREAHRQERQLRPENVVLMQEGKDARSPGALADASSTGSTRAAGASASQAAAESGAPDKALAGAGSTPAASAVAAASPADVAASATADSLALASTEPGAICLEAAYYAESEMPDLERALGKLATKRQDWTVRTVPAPATWLVYMGPYTSPQEAERKQGELRKMGLAFEEVRSPAPLVPGLSLGRYSEISRANERLAELQRKGIRTAQVQEAMPARNLYAVRMSRADARLQAVAVAVRPALHGRRFAPCP